MDQSKAINALAPFVALAKSANSPRAAADLVTQAISSPNTYVFAELLQQPNIQSLTGDEQYGSFHTLLQIFAWGTWESYKATPDLPTLSDGQATKLRLLSLLTIASTSPNTTASNLSYSSLCARLDLANSSSLETLVTQGIYSNLLTGTLNPNSQTICITSVAPLRDLAPGSVSNLIASLQTWSSRCDSVLSDLEAEMSKVKAEAEKRAKRDAWAEKQIRAVTEASDKSGVGLGNGLSGQGKTGHIVRGDAKRAQMHDEEDEENNEDAMDIDGESGGGGRSVLGSRKKGSGGGGSGGAGALMNRLRGAGR